MPRSREDQRRVRAERYAHYQRLCEDFDTLRQDPWDPHYQQLRAQKILDDTLRDAGRPRKPMTVAQRALVGAEWCVFCREDCLPITRDEICGFCSRVPATGELVGKEKAA